MSRPPGLKTYILASIAVPIFAGSQTAAQPAPPAAPQAQTRHGAAAQRMQRGRPFHGDVRNLPQTPPRKRERPEREEPEPNPSEIPIPGQNGATPLAPAPSITPTLNAPAPSPNFTFDGLDFATWGAGHPPDANGDAGPTYYIQAVNTAVGIYRKSDGTRVAAFSLNTLMSQGAFGNLCDTDNSGDPVVLYDTFEDRWVITDFAFRNDASGNVINPPGEFECFAVSRSGDPVAGGWYFYSIAVAGGLGDYPKLGIWPDGIYLSVNLFPYTFGGAFIGPRVYALNKAQLYAGESSVQVQSFDVAAANPGGQDFTLLPSNARLQTGTPPPGTPNYFVSTWRFTNALSVYKFHVDWNDISLSTLTGPSTPTTSTSWPNSPAPNAPSLNGNSLDVLFTRAMMQNQYTNFAGVESLWATHTVRRQDTSGFAAPRWYQVNVTGGTIANPLLQAATWDPDGANVMYRFLPSLAVDRAGDMALGYSTSSGTTKPAIMYAGRLSSDALNTFSQTEQVLYQGTGTQSGNCGGTTCIRWGDYSSMTLDPDGCRFWYTNEYYAVDGLNDLTRIGAFNFPGCTALTNAGTLQGTVTSSSSGNPIAGAAVSLGSRVTYTDANGFYAFRQLASGTYPSLSASAAGFAGASVASLAVSDTGVATRDFALADAPAPPVCLTDTLQADFQTGVPVNCDLTTFPDSVVLNANVDQQQVNRNAGAGTAFNVTAWLGQTFVPSVTGYLTKLDVDLFCSSCSGTNPNITVEVRNTSGGLPTTVIAGAATTISGFSSSSQVFYTATFATPPVLTAGTQYAFTLRLATARTAGNYQAVFSPAPSDYPYGDRVLTTNSGSTWMVQQIVFPVGTPASARDLLFRTYIQPTAGTFTSSAKDSNPAIGFSSVWNTLSWNSSTPGATSLTFQGAGSNDAAGPFDFVGPDGTAATFFNSGDDLSQFNGFRYFRYRAQLTTGTSGVTPTINDVTACFDSAAITPSALAVPPVNAVYGAAATASATLTVGGAPVSGKTVVFKMDGETVGSAGTDANGLATLSGISIAGINAGTYPARIAAAFAGDLSAPPASLSNALVVANADQAIDFAALADRVATDPPFTISATGGGSGNPVTFSTTTTSVCTLSGSTVTLVAAGTCSISADQAGSSNYNPAPTVTQSFNVTKASQSITFPPMSGFVWNSGSATLAATADSGLTVVFSVLSGPCSVSGTTLTASGAGTCVVAADQPGDGRYAAAPQQTSSVTVAQAPQTITFAALVDHVATDAPFALSATGGGSPQPVVFSSISPGVCTVSGNTVALVAAGTCTIDADQAGDANWLAAPTVAQSFNVTKASQAISFPPVAAFVWKTQTATLAASADSGLAIVYGTASPCSISGTTLSATGAGSCDVTADQPGNGKYAPAAQVKITVSVSKAPQSISFAPLPDRVATDAPFAVAATGGASGEPVTFSTASTGVCDVTGTTVTLLGSGTCAISADQAGDADYDPAPEVTQSFNVAKASQTITFPPIASFVWSGGSTALAAGASSGLPVAYSVVSGNCAIAGSSVTATHAGSCIIAADQPGNAKYAAAPQTTTTVNVDKASQAIGFGAIADHYSTAPAFTLSATGGASGNAVTFSTASTACNVNGSQVTPLVIGVCTVFADQAGNADYTAAPQVSRTFNVLATPQTIAFAPIAPFGWRGGSASLSAIADSGLAVSFSVRSGPCAIAAGTLTAAHAGSCLVAADQPGDNRYAAAAEVTQTATILKASQAISFAPLPDKVATDPAFTVTASGGGSGSAVTFSTTSSACTVSGNTVTLLAAGTCSISADQAGNADYDDAVEVTQSFNVAFAAQTIDFPAVSSFNWFGGSGTLAASATSGLDVTYTVLSGPCSISGTTVTATAAGSCTIAADQPGDARYTAATQVRQTVIATKTAQSISFPPLASFVWLGGSTTASASATSGLAVVYSVVFGPCAVSGSTVTASAAGVCVIGADQPGNAIYAPAAQAIALAVVGKANQSISFGAIADHVATDAPFTVAATGGGSGQPVTFSTASAACSVSANVVSLLAAGTCAIAADQAGDANYNAAAEVVQSFNVAFADQTIAFPAISPFNWFGGSATLSATASSGLAPVYSVLSGPCSVSGSTVTATSAGACTIAADQPGDSRYKPARQVTQTAIATRTPQAISFPAIGPFAWNSGSATLSATATSGLAVFYSVVSGPCAISGSVVTATGAGTCVIAADQAGSAVYAAAPQATASVAVAKASQTIAFGALADRVATDAPFTVSATGGASGAPVTFSTTSWACSVSGNTVTLLAGGACSISADQAGNADYENAAEVTQSFNVAFAAQTIDFPAVNSFNWFGGSATLAASATSSLGVSYSVLSGPCSVSGATVTATAAGSCTIAADQPGDARYAAAAQVTQTVIASKTAQSINFPSLASFVWSGGSASASATATSGLAVVYSVVSGPCAVLGSTVTAGGAGVCVIAADQGGNAIYAAAVQAIASVTVGKASQSISFGAIADHLATDAAFTITATGGGSSQAVTFSTSSSACSVSGNTVSLLAAGTCAIDADQAGNSDYLSAPRVTQSFNVALAGQTIDFPAVGSFIWWNGSATLSASATSSLGVTYGILSGPCTVAGNVVTATGAGTCTIAADQAGDARYAAAARVTQTAIAAKASQAITFPALAPFVWSSGSATLGGAADSGLAVSYGVASGPCQIVSGAVAASHAGSCVITADQPGDSRYAAAARATQSVTVLKAPQAISFAALPDKVATDADFTVAASGGASGSPVTFSTTSGAVCSVGGSTVTLLAAGTCSISADQAGNSDYDDAPQVTNTFAVAFATQTIDFPAVTSFNWSGGSATLAASATSGLAVTYGVLSGPCSISGNTVTASGAGNCTLAADQSGDARYAAAPQATQTVVATKTPQSIAFPAIAPFIWNLGSTTVAASATSGLSIAYTVVSGPCAVTGTTVTASAAGVCTIAADQAGNAVYAAAARVSATVSAGKASQSISFGALPSHVATDAPFTVSATGGGSGLPVTFSTASTACSVSGNVVTILAAGTCAIAADEAGDANYGPAVQVVQSFAIAFASQAITFPAVPGFVWKTSSTTVAASASSGLPIAYTVVSGPCAISGTTVTSNHAGNCVIAADQAGDGRYTAAAQVTTTVAVRGAPQAIRFVPMPDKLATDAPFAVPATGDASGNPVIFSTSSAACSVSGAMVTLKAAGTCAITADQAGNADYEPAPTVTQDLAVSLAPQTITFAQIAPYSRRDAPEIPLVATSSSGLGVVFSLVSGPCRVNGTTLTSLSPGKCTIGADQPGDTRYGPAHVEQTVTITDAVTASVGGCASTSPGMLAFLGLAAIGLLRRRRPRRRT